MKKLLAFVLTLVAVLSLTACSEAPPSTEDSDSISFRWTDFSSADRMVLRNLHNGRETELTAPEDLKAFAKMLKSIRGDGKESQMDHPGGIYELSVFAGEENFFSIGFGDDATFSYGDFGDGYPCRYHLIKTTTQELTDFFSSYDSSLSPSSKPSA